MWASTPTFPFDLTAAGTCFFLQGLDSEPQKAADCLQGEIPEQSPFGKRPGGPPSLRRAIVGEESHFCEKKGKSSLPEVCRTASLACQEPGRGWAESSMVLAGGTGAFAAWELCVYPMCHSWRIPAWAP